MKQLLVIAFTVLSTVAYSQKYFTRSGEISFYSSTPVEDIEAHSNSASSIFDVETGAAEFSVPMKSFQFEKALMQEHFNENYVESDEYPKGTFKGKFTNIENVDFSTKGEYPVNVEGKLTIHGVTKEIKASGYFIIDDGIKGEAQFTVSPSDFDIEIPDVVRDKIAKVIKIKVSMNYKEFKR